MPNIGDIKRGLDIGKLKGSMGTYKYQWVDCPFCHKARWVRVLHGRDISSLVCRHCTPYRLNQHKETHPMWRGGRYTARGGYQAIMIDDNDLFVTMRQANGYILEHRLIMAKHLKRCLSSWECVHHRNGNKADN
jgi:hypothetical protein